MHVPLPALLGGVMIGSEVAIGRWRRAGPGFTDVDRNSFRIILATIVPALVLAVFLGLFLRVGRIGGVRAVAAAGAGLWVCGLFLRWYAIVALGRLFTVTVAVAEDHRIVEAGPYRILRHPSYTGVLLAVAGIFLCFDNWIVLGAALLPVLTALLNRIRVEEAALTVVFGDVYRGYAARTWRLVPWVY
jgi:protein-S-isoprenylcysteine O-methyltransferase